MERGLNNSYPESFRQQVLEDYFRSNGTIKACAAKWGIPKGSLGTWLKTCKNAEKNVPLHSKSLNMDAKSEMLEQLRAENEKLRRNLEFERLRVRAYERLIEIVKEEDGIDVLKKDGAKQ